MMMHLLLSIRYLIVEEYLIDINGIILQLTMTKETRTTVSS